jgi:hypothetical protein
MRVACFFASSFLLFAQPSPQTAPSTLPDPQALAAFAKMQAASGWSTSNAPADAVASGMVTRYRGDTQDTVGITLKFRGYSQARFDVGDPASPSTTIINGEQAAVSKSGGTHSIPPRSALSTSMALPFFCSLLNASDSNLASRFVGTETVNGQAASRLEIDYIPPDTDLRSRIQWRAWHLTVWISIASSLPVQIQYARISNDNPTAVFLATRVYSDYRTVNGIAVAFHQEEYAGTQLLSTLQLNSVTFNAGLADADFVIAVAGQ